MDGGIAAIVGAFIGAGAVTLGAWINAHSLRNQAESQAVVEHGHWRRQGRFEAYEQFVDALFRALGTLEQNRMEASGPESATDLDDSVRALSDASNKVLLAGPELMSEFARRICAEYRNAKDMLQDNPVVPVEADEWQVTADSLLNLATIFPLAARKVLDAPTPKDVLYPNEVLPDD